MQKTTTVQLISLLFLLFGATQLYSSEQAVIALADAKPKLEASKPLAQLPLAPAQGMGKIVTLTKEHTDALTFGLKAGLVPVAGFIFCVWLAWQARAAHRPITESALAVIGSAATQTALYLTYKGVTYALSYVDLKAILLVGALLYGVYSASKNAVEHAERHHAHAPQAIKKAE